jgi:hypothetical protein
MTIAPQYGQWYCPRGRPTNCWGSHGQGHGWPSSLSGPRIPRAGNSIPTALAGEISDHSRSPGDVMSGSFLLAWCPPRVRDRNYGSRHHSGGALRSVVGQCGVAVITHRRSRGHLTLTHDQGRRDILVRTRLRVRFRACCGRSHPRYSFHDCVFIERRGKSAGDVGYAASAQA